MVDMFSLLLSHGLILLAFWRLIPRTDLDVETDPQWRGSLGYLRAEAREAAPDADPPQDAADA